MTKTKHAIGCEIESLVPKHGWLWNYFKGQVRVSRKRSLERNVAHQLSVEFLIDLVERQDFKCAVSNILFRPPRFGGRDPFQPSIDRIDNERGYEKDNVRIVCLIVNLARSDFGDDALVKMANAITAHFQ